MFQAYSSPDVAASEAPDSAALTGFVLYSGKSLLSEQRIVAIATLYSANAKTGDMVQLWILPAETSPLEALKRNDNAGACGRCPMQGVYDPQRGKMIDRVCYVNIGQAPQAIWQAYQRGRYPAYNRKRHANLIDGRTVRLGAYGDPAALPIRILRDLVALSSGHSGYSHQLFDIDRRRADLVAQYCMVSCETPAQHVEAVRRGWRPFTVIRPDEQPPAGAIECPHYSHKVQCATCGLCGGTSRRAKPVYVIAHAKTGLNLGAVQDRLNQEAIA
jgi:hypothetical protein